MARVRLDTLLLDRGLYPSRSRAAAAVIAGDVHLGTGRLRAEKPGQLVAEDVEIDVAQPPPYVSRGGIKLANALDALGVEVAGRHALDVGASTGAYGSSDGSAARAFTRSITVTRSSARNDMASSP